MEILLATSGEYIKVHFNAFWQGFDEKPRSYFINILKAVYNKNVVESNERDSHILIESVFGNTKIHVKKWLQTYHYSGEPFDRLNVNKYTVSLSGRPDGYFGNNIGTPLYGLYLWTIPTIPDIINYIPKMPLKDVVCLISNPNGYERNRFLNELDKHFNVTYAGRFKNNTNGPLPYDYGTTEFTRYISQFKFVITMENNSHEHYVTEKIFHGISAGTIPIYWGSSSVGSYINLERILHLTDLSQTANIISRMKEIATDENLWCSIVSKPWKAPGKSQPTIEYTASKIRDFLKISL
jgi:hypothetical protein